jgi:hypothetical protein
MTIPTNVPESAITAAKQILRETGMQWSHGAWRMPIACLPELGKYGTLTPVEHATNARGGRWYGRNALAAICRIASGEHLPGFAPEHVAAARDFLIAHSLEADPKHYE